MRLAPRWRPPALLTGALLVAGCLAPHNVPLVNVWVVNTGPDDRIVLASDAEGTFAQPGLLIPADGFPRSTPGATLESRFGSTLVIQIYDRDCSLLDTVEMGVGSFLVTIGDAETLVAELARAGEPTGAELANAAPVSCTP
jgi:hypothetical protein